MSITEIGLSTFQRGVGQLVLDYIDIERNLGLLIGKDNTYNRHVDILCVITKVAQLSQVVVIFV